MIETLCEAHDRLSKRSTLKSESWFLDRKERDQLEIHTSRLQNWAGGEVCRSFAPGNVPRKQTVLKKQNQRTDLKSDPLHTL